ncbi:hypothetical protein SMACR_05087 [Sordaria macrospora]|uniref:WGS project CABT00000000 data, contig 2.22 n=2 Tax=Sordaria macrospora TaxID=5147 RepID=F7W2M4_SORMK|nr:uncharacterized protein SMAC_05087 [Sordaria macrospora k-hell]KAA8633514.1 hypothetical protein SMACR_05087 [Sordaria macrospora]KAH7632537.1 hypothetical protein B0T09DRAFT_406177 [Sordaria sp. MPI-SDFR-AT-0083]WPJ60976.1 hypothetical protein SMAC4_05087 [Sordaria macrospora]CCC11875.1 unnamed protein product [Sordaria macrospora k-hell]
MCNTSIRRYAHCACMHEWVVPCRSLLFQGPQEKGKERDDDSYLSSEGAIAKHKPKVVAFLKNPRSEEWDAHKSCDDSFDRSRDVTTFETGACPACKALVKAKADPQHPDHEGQKIVHDAVVVEVPLNLGKRKDLDWTPRSYYYIHRRKYVFDGEGHEHMEGIVGDLHLEEENVEGTQYRILLGG